MSSNETGSRRLASDEAAKSHDDASPAGRANTSARPDPAEGTRTVVKPAKTSAAAAFALVFGLSSLLSVLTLVLAPLAVLLAVVGIVLGVVGLAMAKRVGVTGKGVAIGVTTFLNDDAAVNRLDQQVQKMRDDLPTKVQIPTP